MFSFALSSTNYVAGPDWKIQGFSSLDAEFRGEISKEGNVWCKDLLNIDSEFFFFWKMILKSVCGFSMTLVYKNIECWIKCWHKQMLSWRI